MRLGEGVVEVGFYYIECDEKNMLAEADLRTLRHKAIQLLARRDHARLELKTKLRKYSTDLKAIQTILDELVERDYLNDQRFGASYIRIRAEKGYGPIRIEQELYERGLTEHDAACAFDLAAIDWFELIQKVFNKKYSCIAAELNERAKQQQFLYYRGFAGDHVKSIYRK